VGQTLEAERRLEMARGLRLVSDGFGDELVPFHAALGGFKRRAEALAAR
jgi:hypothetical protein